jgi:peptidyl-prolyl cis-trans isomerase B (cyclophilin B)
VPPLPGGPSAPIADPKEADRSVNLRVRTLLALVAVALLIAASACSQKPSGSEKSAADTAAESQVPTESATETDQGEWVPENADDNYSQLGAPLYEPEYIPTGEEVAVVKTNKGTITMQLFGVDAPATVGSFVELAQHGFYDDMKFHRYEPDFVVQGGDPQTKALSSEQVVEAAKNQGMYEDGKPPLGVGGPGYFVPAEFEVTTNPNKHGEGAVGLARAQDPNSGGSQFYFVLAPADRLDGQYTVFAQVTDGLDVMKALRIGDVIKSVEIKNASE